MIDNEGLTSELKSALPTVNPSGDFFGPAPDPGVSDGTLVGKRLWVQRPNEWLGVDFITTPTAQQRTTASETVKNHAPTAVQLMRAKFKAAGLEPPALWAKLLKDTPAQWDQLTAGQQTVLNAMIGAGAVATRTVVQA